VATASTTQERAAELNFARKQRSLWGDALYRLMRNKAAVAGLIVIGAAFFVAIFAQFLAPYDPILIPQKPSQSDGTGLDRLEVHRLALPAGDRLPRTRHR
jgi:ABC-type dipeptide/oligopeptide/nickel transport system permease subunit